MKSNCKQYPPSWDLGKLSAWVSDKVRYFFHFWTHLLAFIFYIFGFPFMSLVCMCQWQFKICFSGSLPFTPEKAMAPHSSTLAWKIPWTEEPGGLQSMGSLRVRHDWVTSFSLFTFMHWRRKWQPTPVFLPGGSQGRGGLPSMGSHRIGHDWSDLAAAAFHSDPKCLLSEKGHQEAYTSKKFPGIKLSP